MILGELKKFAEKNCTIDVRDMAVDQKPRTPIQRVFKGELILLPEKYEMLQVNTINVIDNNLLVTVWM